MNWAILVLISAVSLAVGHVFVKKLLFKEHAQELLTTLTFSVTIILLLILFPQLNFDIAPHYYIILYLKSLIVATGWILTMKAYRHTEISEIAPLHNISPLFLVLLSYFFLGEILSAAKISGIFLMLIGTYVLETRNHSRSVFEPFKMFKRKYINYIMIAIFLFSVSAMLDKAIAPQIGAPTYLFLSYLLISINFFIVQNYRYKGIKDVMYVLRKSGPVLILIAILYAITDIAYMSAVVIPSSFISLIIPLKRISTVIETIIGGNIFKEKNILRKLIACIILVIGVYFIVR